MRKYLNRNNEKGEGDGGVTILGVVVIVFIILKIVGTITWSWWWVLSPFWVPVAVILVIALFAAMFNNDPWA